MESTLDAGFDRRELLELIWATRDDALTPEQATRLDHLVCHNHSARDCYFDAMGLLASLRWTIPLSAQNLQALFLEIDGSPGGHLADHEMLSLPRSSRQSRRPAAILARCIPAWSGFSVTAKTIAFAVSGLLVTYFSLLVLSIVWDRAHPLNRSRDNLSSNEPSYATFVGAVDCEWNGQTPAMPGEPLHNSIINLQKGVVDLSFNDGAKVTIEGPAEFEVRSPKAGFLRRGKLVAMVPPKAVGFTIETPTATIIDLGTEFGVEVDPSGLTQAQVFRGAVKVQLASTLDGNTNEENAVVLQENESVRIGKSIPGGQQALTVRKDEDSGRFVRSLPAQKKPLQLLVLAHFRMGEDDPGATAGQPAAEQATNHGRPRHLKAYGSPTYASDAAPGSALAMNFTGAPDEYLFRSDLHADYVDEFILEAWVRPNRVQNQTALILYKGCGYTDGYGIGLAGSTWSVPRGGPPGGGWMNSEIECEPGKWTHLALVREHGKFQLWIDGRLAKDFGDQVVLNMPSGAFTIGGAPQNIADTPNGFDGQIDEVRLSKFRAPFDPQMLLFKQSQGEK